MFFELAVTALAYRFIRLRFKRPGIGKGAPGVLTTRADARGAEGEALAHAKLKETLNWLCGPDYYLHEGGLVLEHAPGTEFPTAEIDHIAVTQFGIFVFETKHWSGHIAPSRNSDMLIRLPHSGPAEERRSPLAQNRTKVAFLRTRLPRHWQIVDAGLFTAPDVHLDRTLDSNLLTLAGLPQWRRIRRDAYAGKPAIDVTKAAAAIALYSDSSATAIAHHKARCKLQNLQLRIYQ